MLMFITQLYKFHLLPDTGVEVLLKRLPGNNSKLQLCLMDFLFLLEKPWDSTGSLRLAFGVRIIGEMDSWAEKKKTCFFSHKVDKIQTLYIISSYKAIS